MTTATTAPKGRRLAMCIVFTPQGRKLYVVFSWKTMRKYVHQNDQPDGTIWNSYTLTWVGFRSQWPLTDSESVQSPKTGSMHSPRTNLFFRAKRITSLIWARGKSAVFRVVFVPYSLKNGTNLKKKLFLIVEYRLFRVFWSELRIPRLHWNRAITHAIRTLKYLHT